MAGSSTGSMGSINICDCGKRAAMYTSWSLKNPGRRFFTCSEKAELRCEYFQWFDQEVDGRNGDVITHSNNRRIFLEEKIKLLEEMIVILEGKVAKKKGKNRAMEKTVMISKLIICVFVALFAMLLMVCKSKSNSGWLQLM
ncbi:hypothetical protein ACET3Z_028395 [Daucus carota]